MVRRVVLVHAIGRYAGLRRILGTETQLRPAGVAEFPAHVEPVDFLDHQGAAVLAGIKKRYVRYNEVTRS